LGIEASLQFSWLRLPGSLAVTAGHFALQLRFQLESAPWLIGATAVNLLAPHATDGIPKATGKS